MAAMIRLQGKETSMAEQFLMAAICTLAGSGAVYSHQERGKG